MIFNKTWSNLHDLIFKKYIRLIHWNRDSHGRNQSGDFLAPGPLSSHCSKTIKKITFASLKKLWKKILA
jgi:hypothetical protein